MTQTFESWADAMGLDELSSECASAEKAWQAALRQAIAQPATTEWTVIAPDGTRFTGPTPLKAALPASKYRLEIDPVAAVKFMEIIDQEAEKGRQEAEQCMRDYGTLDCPACGGSGHIGDVKQPAQMQINCDDCVYHYKDADQKPCAMCIHGTGLYDNFEPRIPAAQEVK